MHTPKLLCYLALVLSLSACSTAPERAPFSGQPLVDIRGISSEELQSRIALNCLNGGRVVQSSQFSVTCARPMGSSMSELMYRALLTEKYASNPDVIAQIAWASAGDGTMRITATMWLEHQSAFGKTTRNDLNDDSTKYTLQDALDNLKHKIEASKPQ